MPIKPRITEAEVDQMVADYTDNTTTLKDLVKKYGRKVTTIRKKFQSRGIAIEYNRSRKIPASIRNQVIDLYTTGQSMSMVAQKLNISHGAVHNILRESQTSVRNGIVNEWTNDDIKLLENLLQDKSRPINEIAQRLNRSYDAIIDKICKQYPHLKRDHQALGIRTDFHNTIYRSIAESEVARCFYNNFIQFEYEKKVCTDRQWTCDFYLPEQDIWIEYDGLGKYRRSSGSFVEKIEYYKQHDFHYHVLTPKDKVLDSLGLMIDHQYNFDYKLISKSSADDFLARVHYLGSASKGDQYRLGIYFDDLLVGVVTFGNIANPQEKDLCLTRFAILDRIRNVHPYNNVSSYIIAHALKWLKQQGYRGKIVSWSDPRYHDGVLYKACNFCLVEKKIKPDYVYIDDQGNEYHKSKCRVPAGQSELNYAQSLGLTKVIVPAKQRWEFIIQ